MGKKIVINGYFLTKPFTGIHQHTRNFINELAQQDKENEYHIIVPEKIHMNLPSNFVVHYAMLPPVPTMSLKKMLWEQITVSSLCKRIGADIYHCPYPANPHKYFLRIPTIVTVHDVIPWMHKSYRKKLRSKLYQWFAWRNLKYAKKIISVSEATKKALMKKRIPEKKISVIYNTITKATTKKRYPIKEPYILYVGGYDERKNVKRMCEAFKKAHTKNHLLVMLGKPHDNSSLYQSYSAEKHKKILWTGAISDEEKNYLYKHATAFISCSLDEGFNLPLIEAAAAEIPIIASNIPIHHEVIEKGAIYCNPKSIKSICSAINTVLDISKKESQSLIKKASKAIKKFDPKQEGKKLIKLYQEVMDL